MNNSKLSRRQFFQHAAVAPLAAAGAPTEKPDKAWIIVEVGWEYNDEFTYEQGESPRLIVYFNREEADAECKRLCDEFFAQQSPQEFPVYFECYEVPDTASWEELLEAGFPDPFSVMELQV